MKLTVFGKYGPYEKRGGGATSCYLIEEKDTKILLDMGAASLQNILRYVEIDKLDAIYFTHLHYDHTSDFLTFRYLLEDLGLKINIITKYEESEWYKILFNHPLMKVVNISDGDELIIKDVKCSFSSLTHTVTNTAIKIESLNDGKVFVYTGDSNDYDNMVKVVKGATAAVCDCSKPVGFKGPHLTVDAAVRLQEKTDATIFASHQSTDYDPKEALAGYPKIISVEENQTYVF